LKVCDGSRAAEALDDAQIRHAVMLMENAPVSREALAGMFDVSVSTLNRALRQRKIAV
jgi:hypothetical protein